MTNRDPERYATVSVSEGRISGLKPVYTNREHLGKLRLSSHDNRDGTVSYSLESPIVFRRLDIAETLVDPLEIDNAQWPDVQKGLRQISYPHRIIRRMSRSAGNLTHLHSIQHDAGSLAGTMDEHDVRSRNVPVFGYGESRRFAAERLRELDPKVLKLIVEQLLEVRISSRSMRQWTPKQWGRRTEQQKQEILDGFRALLSGETSIADAYGEDRTAEQEKQMMQELLDYLMMDELEDLEHKAAELLFDRFTIEKDLAWDPDDHMGPPPSEVYLRDADIPPGVSRSKDTTVVLGRHLPPRNGRELFDRRRVEFWTEKPRRVVQPVLRWTRDDRGSESVRTFRFGGGESHREQTEDGVVISYHSPLVGAAIAAIHFGGDNDYTATLRRFTGAAELSKRHAGLLPLVLGHHQESLLDNSYIRQSERLVDEHVR